MLDPGPDPLNLSPEERWINRCLDLARNGCGYVSPNPLVGAVIILDGEIVAEGWHEQFGGPHAEVNALRNFRAAGGDPHGATLAVNLEPCNFTGKTPPCTDLIIKAGIKRVVVGMLDPNPKVSGNGIKQLNAAGIETSFGILEPECRRLNRAFTKFIATGVPFVIIKSAQTLDGRIALTPGEAASITGPEAIQHSHVLRSEVDAILVGAETVRADNPKLTVRHAKGRNPARIILSPRLNIDRNSSVFQNAGTERVIVFTAEQGSIAESVVTNLVNLGVIVHRLPLNSEGRFDLRSVLGTLASERIASVLVEGGAVTADGFMSQQLADRLALYIAPKVFGTGPFGFSQHPGQKPTRLTNIETTRLGEDMLIEGDFEYESSLK